MREKHMIVSEAIEKMIAFYKGSIRDIDHFIKVWSYAKTIGELEGWTPTRRRFWSWPP